MNVYLRELSRELGQRGFALDIFTRRTSPDDESVIRPFENVRVVQLDCGPPGFLEKEELFEHLREFTRGVEHFAVPDLEIPFGGPPYDLIHSHYWLSGAVGLELARRWNVPHVAMFHTLGEVKNRARGTEKEPRERIEIEREIARTADRIVVASLHERNLLTRLYDAPSERIVVEPLGVDLSLFQPVDREEARRLLGLGEGPIVLFVGRIEPLKGLDLLVKALGELDGPFTLLVVGGDERASGLLSEIRVEAGKLGIERQIVFAGSVQHDRLPLYYSAADVCVVPSYYESFGLVAVEAMACGTPVVASRVGGLTSTVRDGVTGYLIPWRCPEPFTERLETLLANGELRDNLGAAARRAAQEFGWERVGDGIASLYRSLLTPQKTARPA
ncbi:MAG TPA: glycosyltransferase [Dehalococcoidia bacterium]|nr:glycosyltransferase [Dehalococcoidia bacterium]